VLGEQTVYLDEVGNVCLTLTGLVPHLASVKRSTRLHVEANSVQVATPLVACSNGPYLYRIKRTLCNLGYQLQLPPVHLSFRNTRTTQDHQAARYILQHAFPSIFSPNNAYSFITCTLLQV
jgi:hypothetical protein